MVRHSARAKTEDKKIRAFESREKKAFKDPGIEVKKLQKKRETGIETVRAKNYTNRSEGFSGLPSP